MFAHGSCIPYRLPRWLSVVVLAALGACSIPSTPPETELPPIAPGAPRPAMAVPDGRWELVGSTLITGGRLPGAPRPTLEFKDGRLAAFSGCNRANGSVVNADGRMSVGRLATTRMACPEPLAGFEGRFFRLIESEPLMRTEHDQLVLVAGDDNARFQRATDAIPAAKQ